MKNKLIILVSLTIFFAYACNINVENQQKQNDDQIQEKVSEEKTNGQGAENLVADNSEESVTGHKFININKDSFAFDRKDRFEIPSYDFIKKYDLQKLDDEDFTKRVCNSARVDEVNASLYLFSLEKRLSDMQDFTVFITSDYSRNVVYCILDNNNKLVNTLKLSYEIEMGESMEEASGEFVEDLKCQIRNININDAFEEPDGSLSASTESSNKEMYVIKLDGTIEEL